MRRRTIIVALGGAVLAGPWRAQAQPERVRWVGVLIDGSAPHPLPNALRAGLGSLGYVEGRTIAFDVRYADGQESQAAAQAADLVRTGVDVIVAHYTPSVRAAMAATKTIPIVMAPAGAPVEVGLVQSLSRPGGNVTGVTNMAAELGGRRLQLLKDTIPNLNRVAVLASTQDAFTRPFLSYMEAAITKGDLQLDPVMVTGPGDFEAAFAKIVSARAGATVIQGVFNSQHATIIELAMRHRVPTMWFDRQAIVDGGFISLSANTPNIFKRAAVIVDKILRGANPADLPVEQPTIFELLINLKTAHMLGIEVPPRILLLADEVIE